MFIMSWLLVGEISDNLSSIAINLQYVSTKSLPHEKPFLNSVIFVCVAILTPFNYYLGFARFLNILSFIFVKFAMRSVYFTACSE